MEAAKELLARRKARKGFWAYCQYIDPVFFNGRKPHLKKTAKAMQEIADGKIKKLMISMPTRAGKSYITSHFCAWMLGNNPEGSIMRNCYGASLALTFSRDVRDFITDPKYQILFPHIKLSKTQSAVDEWALETSKTSAYFCAGVGGAINGKGCTICAILDDPVKNLEEACSENVLEKAWNWKLSSHNRRMEGDCPEIIISTRWSRRDPSGKSLEIQAGQWKEIKIPALDKNDKSFCEEVRTTAQYLEMRRIEDPVIWNAVSMQEPIEAMGLLYPREELNTFTMKEVEKYDNGYGRESWDGVIGYTDTADEGTDFLSSVIGKRLGENVYITDVVFTQEPVEITEGLVANQIVENNPDLHIVESNSGGKGFARNIKEVVKGQSKAQIKWRPTTTKKETRMIMKAGKVKAFFWFRSDYEKGSDYDKFMRQLTATLRMGKNIHDDAADSITGLAEMLDKKGMQFA